ncbi:hypothetical protein ABVK25_008749 [Lepraria finkii]|uniref:Uncharacterized protein n=1 Tax=Lepraria finkii TaxID=1340010 RepID=A0ABR4B0R7_9LECA
MHIMLLILGFLLKFCGLALAAPPPLAQPTSVFTTEANHPLPSFATSSNSSNRLPTDPYYLHIPNTALTLRFAYYSVPIPEQNVTEIFIAALRDALVVHHRDKTPMGEKRLFYPVKMNAEQELQLNFLTGPSISWDDWWHVINGLRTFMRKFEFVSLAFSVKDESQSGAVFLGHGSVAVVPMAV